jgi:putative oxidoreductase
MFCDALSKYKDAGLLLLRVGLGLMFIYYGAPKLLAGPKMWQGLGMAMGSMGINFLPTFWGFMAAFSMAVGGVCLIFGIFFRPFCVLLTITMLVATSMHLRKGDGFLTASHALNNAIVFLSLFFIGPGKYSLMP